MKLFSAILGVLFLIVIVLMINLYQNLKHPPQRWIEEELIGLTLEEAILILGAPDEIELEIKGILNWVDYRSNKLMHLSVKLKSDISNKVYGDYRYDLFSQGKAQDVDYSILVVDNVYIKDRMIWGGEKEKMLGEKAKPRNVLKNFNNYTHRKQ